MHSRSRENYLAKATNKGSVMNDFRYAALLTAAAIFIAPLACSVEDDDAGPATLQRDADLDFAEIVQDVNSTTNVLVAYNDESLPVSRFIASSDEQGGKLTLEIVDDAGEPARLVQTLSGSGDRITIEAFTVDVEYRWSGGVGDDLVAGFEGIPAAFVPHLALWAESFDAQPDLTQHSNGGLVFRDCADTCFWTSLVVCAAVGAGSGGAGGLACSIYAHYICKAECGGS
jgi:hypothetical protein